MKQAWCYARAWRAVAALLLVAWTNGAVAQDDPLGDVDEPAPEGAPAEEPAPEEPAPEPTPPEPAPTGEVQAEGEFGGEIGAEGSLEADLPQAEEAPAAAPAETGEQEMIVTGSRVKRSSFAQPSAVQVVDRKQLELSGADNMADVVKNMTINSGSQFNTDVATAAVGTAQFNLRGLGFASTLTLLNGRRMVYSGGATADGSNFVDINTIPLGVIERIEVLKGGASAIYGSDAIAGVVNIITRKHMDGFEAKIGALTTDKFDHHEWEASLIGGAEGENTRVMGAASYFKRQPLMAEDRDFTENGRNVSRLGYPAAFVEIDPTNGRPRPLINPMTMMPVINPATNQPIPSIIQDPGCGVAPLSSRETEGPVRLCPFDFNSYYMLMVDEQRANVMTTVEQDIGDHTMAFFEALYGRNHTWRQLSPSYPILQNIVVSPAHAYNFDGDPLVIQGRVAGGDSEGYINEYDSDTLHTVAGIGGDLGGISDSVEDWEWELSGSWSTNRFKVFANDVITSQFVTALGSCTNTGMAGATGSHNPANCWNPFYPGDVGAPNSRAIRDRITGELRTEADVELTTANLDIGGPIVALPGGDLAIAVGGQVRRETAIINADHDSNQEAYIFLIGGPDWEAERRIFAGYAEIGAPVLPGMELQIAGRIEDYEDVGSTVDPMFGLSWTPATTFMGDEASQASKVRIRGTYSTAFRAPSLLQTNGAATELRELFEVNANPDGTPMTSTASVYRAVRSTGNSDLDPQTSTAVTAGFDWSPVTGLFIEGDFWLYDYKDIIVKEDAQQILAGDFNRMGGPNNTPDPRIVRDPLSGSPQVINVSYINAEEVTTKGIDANIMYRTDFGATAGMFSVGITGSYVLSYEIPQTSVGPNLWDNTDVVDCSEPGALAAGGPSEDATCDVAGSRNIANFASALPRLRFSAPIGWNLDMHTAAVTLNYIGSYKDDFDSDPSPMEDFRDIDAWFTVDLQYQLRIDEGDDYATTIKIGVVNLLDSEPPPVNTGLGYDTVTHDPRGRLLYAQLKQDF